MVVGICDDDKFVLEQAYDIVMDYASENNCWMEIHTYENLEKLEADIRLGKEYDLVFMDIEVGSENGIDTAVMIMEKSPLTIIVFMTAHSKYIKQAFAARPIEFLNKPLDADSVKRCISRAYELIGTPECFVYEKHGYSHRMIIKEIYYMESVERVIKMYTKNGMEEFYGRLDTVEQIIKQKDQNFLRIHKSYLVNTRYIVSKKKDYIEIQMADEIGRLKISRGFKTQVSRWYVENIR